MTTALDRSLKSVVTSVARALGTDITWRQITAGTYSTSSGGATDTETDTSVDGFVLEDSQLDAFGLAKAGDKAVGIPAAALSTAPTTQDRFLIGSTVYAVSNIDVVRARDDAVLYIVQGHGPA